MSMENEIVLNVMYGLGATATTLVSRQVLAGCTVREAIEIALKAPQAPGSPEQRAALVIAEALRSGRPLDVEVGYGPSEGVGKPVALDDVVDRVLSGGDRSDHTEDTTLEEELTVSLTEPYRGGARR